MVKDCSSACVGLSAEGLHISFAQNQARNDKLHQWLPLAAGTAYENASLLDVASHTACLISEGAPRSQELVLAAWAQYTVGGIPASRAVYVNNSLHHPPLPNCTPELNTETRSAVGTFYHFPVSEP